MNSELDKNSMVFLPGWGFSAQIWHAVCQKINMDTIKSAQCLSLPDQAIAEEMVLQYLVKNIPDHSTLVAWSLSGLFALKLLAKYPQKIAHLYLVGSTPYFSKCEKTASWQGCSAVFKQDFISNYQLDFLTLERNFLKLVTFPSTSPALRKAIKKHYMLEGSSHSEVFYLQYLFEQDHRDIAVKNKTKISFILGDQDAIVHPQTIAQLQENAFNVRIIKEAGHVAFLTHTDKFLEILTANLDCCASLAKTI